MIVLDTNVVSEAMKPEPVQLVDCTRLDQPRLECTNENIAYQPP